MLQIKARLQDHHSWPGFNSKDRLAKVQRWLEPRGTASQRLRHKLAYHGARYRGEVQRLQQLQQLQREALPPIAAEMRMMATPHSNYVEAAIQGELAKLIGCPVGEQETTVNEVALILAGMVNGG